MLGAICPTSHACVQVMFEAADGAMRALLRHSRSQALAARLAVPLVGADRSVKLRHCCATYLLQVQRFRHTHAASADRQKPSMHVLEPDLKSKPWAPKAPSQGQLLPDTRRRPKGNFILWPCTGPAGMGAPGVAAGGGAHCESRRGGVRRRKRGHPGARSLSVRRTVSGGARCSSSGPAEPQPGGPAAAAGRAAAKSSCGDAVQRPRHQSAGQRLLCRQQ